MDSQEDFDKLEKELLRVLPKEDSFDPVILKAYSSGKSAKEAAENMGGSDWIDYARKVYLILDDIVARNGLTRLSTYKTE